MEDILNKKIKPSKRLRNGLKTTLNFRRNGLTACKLSLVMMPLRRFLITSMLTHKVKLAGLGPLHKIRLYCELYNKQQNPFWSMDGAGR